MKQQSIWSAEFRSVSAALRHRLTIYSPAELAGVLGIGKRAVLSAIKVGSLRAHKVNSRTFQIESFDAAQWWQGLAG